MTLVLGGLVANTVFHASDRLTAITPTRKNPDRAWDIHANKTVIVCGSDWWLVIGYTGLAYLDDKPTDAFIASVLAGGDELTGMGMWFPGRPLHYREIASSIETAIHDAYSRLTDRCAGVAGYLSATGVQADSLTPAQSVVVDWCSWMREQRGLAEKTIAARCHYAAGLVEVLAAADGSMQVAASGHVDRQSVRR